MTTILKALRPLSEADQTQRTSATRAPILMLFLFAACAAAQTASETQGAAKIVAFPPVTESLALGEAVIPFRVENVRIAPVFGSAALSVYPRVGHLHVIVDDVSWVWAHTSEEPVFVTGLAAGNHRIRVQLMNANHQRLDEGIVTFTMPERRTTRSREARAPESDAAQPPARIILDSPQPEPLLRGVVLFRYRTENLDVVPVFGPSAVAVSPRIGHVMMRVDEARWGWVDGSRNPVIVQGLAPGRHKILVELANSNHDVIDRQTVEVTIPDPNAKRAGRN